MNALPPWRTRPPSVCARPPAGPSRLSRVLSLEWLPLLPEVAVSDQSLKRFMREIEVASSLRHPNIVSYIEHGTHNGLVYLVTEFIQGMDASRFWMATNSSSERAWFHWKKVLKMR